MENSIAVNAMFIYEFANARIRWNWGFVTFERAFYSYVINKYSTFFGNFIFQNPDRVTMENGYRVGPSLWKFLQSKRANWRLNGGKIPQFIMELPVVVTNV